MSYYKRDGESLLVSDCVTLPSGQTLVPDNHASHTYPVEGWWWQDDATDIEDKVGLDTREDVTIVVKNASGVRLFGIRFDRHGIAVRNLSNQSALIDAEGGTQAVSNYSLAAGAFRFVPFNKIFGEPE